MAAAAENGTHYVDLTGEAPFVAHMVRKYARTAVSTSAIIIHSCGFDSVPSDLTTFLAVQRLKRLAGDNVKVGAVRSAFAQKGGASGGTIASALAVLDGPPEDRAIATNPYALSPSELSWAPLTAKADISPPSSRWIPQAQAHCPHLVHLRWSPHLGSLLGHGELPGASFVLSLTVSHSQGPFNSAIVRRTWGIFETSDPSSKVLSYGKDFNYDEYLVASPLLAPFISFAFFIGFAVLGEFHSSLESPALQSSFNETCDGSHS